MTFIMLLHRHRALLPMFLIGAGSLMLSGCASGNRLDEQRYVQRTQFPGIENEGLSFSPSTASSEGFSSSSTRKEDKGAMQLSDRYIAVPSPEDIFNFHPDGPRSFKQPFIINPSEGPLSTDVRHTAFELQKFQDGLNSNKLDASLRTNCSAIDVLTLRRVCEANLQKHIAENKQSTAAKLAQ